jgi:cobalamin biosynthesis protein CobT
MNDISKSILAKLLAKENITVRHGNHPTAYFDMENRILGLPLWKEMDKDVYDLFIGHEVSHALETPADGWHNSTNEIPGCPRAFINVVEDIRIEKLIQRRYPGFVSTFKRGYDHLLNEKDFFEIKDKNVNEMSFMNRLNLKSKLRDLIDVEFSEEEQPYVNKAMNVETWDDVIEACRSIYEYLKEKQKNEKKRQKPQRSAANGRPNPESSNDESSESSEEEYTSEKDMDGFSEQSSNTSNSSNSDNTDEDSDSATDMESRSSNEENNQTKEKELLTEADDDSHDDSDNVDNNLLDVSTDDAQRRNEESLIEKNEYNAIPRVIAGMSRAQLSDILVPYSKIAESRAERLEKFDITDMSEYQSKYKSFVDETTKLVNVMVKEFEMRKAAFQYSRAKTSRSGTLNVNKLHEYRFNDDIFRKITKLADAKSHGMVMLIDYSGSMSGVIKDVIRQTLSLAMFCKKANIPFEVYSFTTDHSSLVPNYTNINVNDIYHRGIRLCQLLSSSLGKRDYESAYKNLFYQTVDRYEIGYFKSEHEIMGATPSIEVMTAMPFLIEEFKAKHNIQKVIFPFLSDGDPSPVSFVNGKYKGFPQTSATYMSMIININGKYIKAKHATQMLVKLCDYLRSLGVITLGYYLTNTNQQFKRKVGHATGSWDKQTFAKAYQERRANKFVSYDNTLGFDRFFVVRSEGHLLSTEIEDFSVREGAKAGEITRAFKKYTSSKRTNRIFATQFAEIIS